MRRAIAALIAILAMGNVAVAYSVQGTGDDVIDPYGPGDVSMIAFVLSQDAYASGDWAVNLSSVSVGQRGIDNGVNSQSSGSRSATGTASAGWKNGSGTSGVWSTGGKYRLVTSSSGTGGGSAVQASSFTGDYMCEVLTAKLRVAGSIVKSGVALQWPEQLRNNDSVPHTTADVVSTLAYQYTGAPPDVEVIIEHKASGSWSGGSNAATAPTYHKIVGFAPVNYFMSVSAETTPECKKPVLVP